MKQILLVFIAILGIIACQKEPDTSAFQIKPYFDAHSSQGNWTENRIFDSLIGTWQWQFRACEGTSFQSNSVDAGLTIQFQKDSSLTAIKNGKTTKTRFKINVEDRTDFAVAQDSFITSLSGRIFFMENKVLFNGSYVDGCDNYFIRVK